MVTSTEQNNVDLAVHTIVLVTAFRVDQNIFL